MACNGSLFPINFFLLHLREVVAAKGNICERSLKVTKGALMCEETMRRTSLNSSRIGRFG
jgi:hypothetical protein